jgi:DNA-directed RNA polymerase subunit beta
MASNMQRQALPLILPHAPTIGTGNEYRVAHDSFSGLLSQQAGTVSYVDSQKIIVGNTTHNLIKFARTNQRTCRNHTPIVNVGDQVNVGDVIADGPAMNNGELSLGQNMLIGFLA